MKNGFITTELGIIPKDWKIAQIADFANIHNNLRYPLSSEIRINKKGQFPYCGANGIVDFIDEYKYDGEYVLMAEDGGNFHEFQTKPIAYLMQGKFWVNNHAHVLSAKNGLHKFLFYSLEHKDITKYVIGSTRTKLNRSVLESIPLIVPTLPEQKKIAEILSTVDEKIEVIEAQIKQTTELKKGLMQQLLTKGIGHTKFKDSSFGKIPESWEVEYLGNITKCTVGIATSATHAYSNSGKLLIRNQNIKEGFIDLSDSLFINEDYEKIHKSKRLKEGDILTVRTGYPGISAVITKDLEGSQSFTTLIIRSTNDLIFSYFLCYFINSEIGKKFFTNNQAGGGQQNVGAKTLEKLLVPLPPAQEQKILVDFFRKIDEKLDNLYEKSKQVNNLKKGLMQQLLTGKIRVNLNPETHAAKSGELQPTS